MPTLHVVNAWNKIHKRLFYGTKIYNPEKDEWFLRTADDGVSVYVLMYVRLQIRRSFLYSSGSDRY